MATLSQYFVIGHSGQQRPLLLKEELSYALPGLVMVLAWCFEVRPHVHQKLAAQGTGKLLGERLQLSVSAPLLGSPRQPFCFCLCNVSSHTRRDVMRRARIPDALLVNAATVQAGVAAAVAASNPLVRLHDVAQVLATASPTPHAPRAYPAPAPTSTRHLRARR